MGNEIATMVINPYNRIVNSSIIDPRRMHITFSPANN